MRFVIICAARTGSSHFASSLGGHPDIFMNGNIFDAGAPDRLYVFWPKEDASDEVRKTLIDLRKKDPMAFFDRVCSANYGRTHVGFKMFQGENDVVLDRLIADTDIRKIILFRRNILASFSSALVARETGKYGQRDGKIQRKDPPKVKFSPEKFASFHDRYMSFFQGVMEKVSNAGQYYFLMNYEDVNDPRVLADIAAFVGADPSKPFSRELQYKSQAKQNSANILSRFSNPLVVKEYLAEHGLRHWMHEGELDMGRRLSVSEPEEGEPVDEGDGHQPSAAIEQPSNVSGTSPE
ncbi:MAG TPA: hypothetical protein VGK90_11760 [Rhizomicrobium sp.]|jgi:hypothetical protein